MTYEEALKAGLIDTEAQRQYAEELKQNALARFTSRDLIRELKRRAKRKVAPFSKYRQPSSRGAQ